MKDEEINALTGLLEAAIDVSEAYDNLPKPSLTDYPALVAGLDKLELALATYVGVIGK